MRKTDSEKRAAIDKLAVRLVKQTEGRMSFEKAREKARESAVRHDRREGK